MRTRDSGRESVTLPPRHPGTYSMQYQGLGGLIVLIDQPGNVIGVITMHDLLRAQMNFANNQQD